MSTNKKLTPEEDLALLRESLAVADEAILSPKPTPQVGACNGVEKAESAPITDDEARMIRNREHIKWWNKNPLTLADLLEVAEDMEERLKTTAPRKHWTESEYAHEKRKSRWEQIAQAALEAARNAIEHKRKEEEGVKLRGWHH